MKENTLIKATKLLLDIMFFAGIAVIVTLPVPSESTGRSILILSSIMYSSSYCSPHPGFWQN